MPIVKSRPWAVIAEQYRSLSEKQAGFRSMQNLVEQIVASKYSSGLFAVTSIHTLLIAQTPEFDWDKEILRVSLDIGSGELVFDFQETGSELAKYQHWIRRSPPEEAFSRLERFLEHDAPEEPTFKMLRHAPASPKSSAPHLWPR